MIIEEDSGNEFEVSVSYLFNSSVLELDAVKSVSIKLNKRNIFKAVSNCWAFGGVFDSDLGD